MLLNEAPPRDIEGEIAFYRELAHLRGELVGYLTVGSHGQAGACINQIENLLRAGIFAQGRSPAVDQRQNLKDALAKMTKAVADILE